MKKFYSLLSISAMAFLAAGCAKEISSPEILDQKDGLWAVFEQPTSGNAGDTKALGPDYKFFWKDAEKITVFGATDGEQLTYRMEASSTAAGKFHATNFKLIDGETYYAVYPALGNVDDLTAVPISFEGQVQSVNDNTDHLAGYAYSIANATVSGNSATFTFSTKVAWFKFDFTFLSDETVNSIELKAGSSVIPTSAKLDVKAGTLVADGKSDHLSLSFGKDGIATVGNKLVAHLAVLPFASEGDLTVSISCKSGSVYTTTIPSLTLEANKYYTASRVIAPATPVLNSDKYYEVYTPEHWNWVTNTAHTNGAKGIKLMNDICFNGGDASDIYDFPGDVKSLSIDGNGHKLSQLVVKRNTIEDDCGYGGLVRTAVNDMTIKDLVIDTIKVDVPVDDPDDVHAFAGALIGSIYNANVTISNVTVRHADVKGVQSVGGLVGFAGYGSKLTINNCTVGDSYIHNYSVENESGCVHAVVGRVIGEVEFTGSNKVENTSIEAYYCSKRGVNSIGKVAGAGAKDGTPAITGMDTVDSDTNVSVSASLIPNSTLTINSTIGADLAGASAYINASSEKVFNIVFTADNTWETGNAGGGANTIFTDSETTVNIDLNGKTLTMTGQGGFKSNAKLNIKNGTIVDETEYTSENGTTAWEFTYLELEGAEMTFDNVVFNNSMMTCSANAVFNNCEFKGIATYAGNQSGEYAVWVNDGKASFKNCKIGNGYRGLKLGDLYSANVSSLVVDGCTFENLSKKPGIAIDSRHNASIVIKNSKFNDVQLGEQGNFIYETDNVKPTLTGNIIGVSKAETLKAIATAVNDIHQTFVGFSFNLLGNIDLENETWTPIGLMGDEAYRFAGLFDGKGYTISNLKVDQTSVQTSAGLFGAICGATIKNFTIDGVEVKSVIVSSEVGTVDGIGAVAGSAAYGAYIDGVTVKNAVLKGNRYVGGIVGYTGGDVTNCHVEQLTITCTPDNLTGSYDNGDKAGGIIGHTNSQKYTDGNISGNSAKNVSITAYRDLGGIIGSAYLGTYNVKDNSVEGTINLTVDQTTNAYGTKAANAGAIVGRILSGSLDASNVSSPATVTINN